MEFLPNLKKQMEIVLLKFDKNFLGEDLLLTFSHETDPRLNLMNLRRQMMGVGLLSVKMFAFCTMEVSRS